MKSWALKLIQSTVSLIHLISPAVILCISVYRWTGDNLSKCLFSVLFFFFLVSFFDETFFAIHHSEENKIFHTSFCLKLITILWTFVCKRHCYCIFTVPQGEGYSQVQRNCIIDFICSASTLYSWKWKKNEFKIRN